MSKEQGAHQRARHVRAHRSAPLTQSLGPYGGVSSQGWSELAMRERIDSQRAPTIGDAMSTPKALTFDMYRTPGDPIRKLADVPG